jgi:hypothetical protein
MDTGNVVGNLLPTLAIVLVVLVVVFLVLREIVCWYWKINLNVALLTEIRDVLQLIRQEQKVAADLHKGQAPADGSARASAA